MVALFAFLYLPLVVLVVLSFNDAQRAVVSGRASRRAGTARSSGDPDCSRGPWDDAAHRRGGDDHLRGPRDAAGPGPGALHAKQRARQRGLLPVARPGHRARHRLAVLLLAHPAAARASARSSSPTPSGASPSRRPSSGPGCAGSTGRSRRPRWTWASGRSRRSSGSRCRSSCRGSLSAALVVFTLSVDEFVIAYFTAGRTVTFPIQVYSMIRFGVTPEINAVATLLLAFSLILIAAPCSSTVAAGPPRALTRYRRSRLDGASRRRRVERRRRGRRERHRDPACGQDVRRRPRAGRRLDLRSARRNSSRCSARAGAARRPSCAAWAGSSS